MHKLELLLTERISTGLRRKSIITPSKWATEYRVMGRPFEGKWAFKKHPWLKEMHDSNLPVNVGQKAAQMGFTETVLNIVFFYIDVHNVDCLYILPSKTPDASDFSAARFDPALEMSPHLRRLFSDVKNVGHKRAGNTNLYLRGAKSRSGLKSVPVGVIVFDEMDEMNQDNIPLARERQSGYDINVTWQISTPTIDNSGINNAFKSSTQNEFFFKCPSCSRNINLVWPDSINICGEDFDDPETKNSSLVCSLCENILPHETKPEWLSTGRWIPAFVDKDVAGWGINQLYSSTPAAHPSKIVQQYFKAKSNPADEQEFFNSKLGLPHIVEGAKLSEKDIESCIGDYITYQGNTNGLVTIGVDVGNYIHFEIDKWLISPNVIDLSAEARCLVLAVGKYLHFEELDELMKKYAILGGVIDMQPERRKAYEFANRFWGRIKLCYYGRGVQGKNIHVNTEDECSVTVDRTSWIDLALSRFRSKNISLPQDIPREYKRHLTSLVRVYEKDIDGNPIGKYVKAGNSEDHFAHTRTYNEIALPLVASLGQPQSMSGRL